MASLSYRSIAVGMLVAVVGGGFALAKPSPEQRCTATKLNETGKKAYGKLRCWAKEVRHSDPTQFSQCKDKVEARFASKFAAAEATGSCPTTGDAGPLETTVDGLVDGVVGALTGSVAGSFLSTDEAKQCASTKLIAAGKKVASKMTCHARAATRGFDGDCVYAAETAFFVRWGTAERKGGCATTDDEGSIEALVDGLVDYLGFDSCGCLGLLGQTCQLVWENTLVGGYLTSCSNFPGENRCVPRDSVCGGSSIGLCPPGGVPCLSIVSSCGGQQVQQTYCWYPF